MFYLKSSKQNRDESLSRIYWMFCSFMKEHSILFYLSINNFQAIWQDYEHEEDSRAKKSG